VQTISKRYSLLKLDATEARGRPSQVKTVIKKAILVAKPDHLILKAQKNNDSPYRLLEHTDLSFVYATEGSDLRRSNNVRKVICDQQEPNHKSILNSQMIR